MLAVFSGYDKSNAVFVCVCVCVGGGGGEGALQLTGLLIFHGKKNQNFAGFSGEKSQNSWKNQPILRDFRGKKVKIRGKIGRFRGILLEKIQSSKDFQGQILRKIGRFHGKFQGVKLRQETISKKQPISLDFFG